MRPLVSPNFLELATELPLVLFPRGCFMSEHRQTVREYVRTTAALLKTDELTDTERTAVKEMLHRLTENLLNDGKP
jgi:hypothetical protein